MKASALLLKRHPVRLLIIVSGFIAAAVAAQFVPAVLRESESSQPVQPSAVMAPGTATKSATIATDNKGNGHVNPGDVIEYSITVNDGATDASGVIFSDMLSNELTLVPGSVKLAPVAGDDSYQTIGNTHLQVAASQTIPAPGIFVNGNVLSNDNDPNGGTLSASAGDTIYVYTGNGTTLNQNSGITLDANQRLIGQGVALTFPFAVNGGPNPTVLLAAVTKPKIGNSAGNGVSVTNISGVQIRGLDISGSDVPIRFTLYGNKGSPYSQPPTSQPIVVRHLLLLDRRRSSTGMRRIRITRRCMISIKRRGRRKPLGSLLADA